MDQLSLVYVKNPNGTTYVYQSKGYWDKEKQQARNRRVCVGKLDPDTGEFVPSKRLTKDSSIDAAPTGLLPVAQAKRRFYGATYLLDSIGEQLGITSDLQTCFPDTYDRLLSLTYFLIMEDRNPMSRFPRWARTHVHPYGREIPSQRSSELLGTIDEHGKQRYFRLQAGRRLEVEFLAYDTTSISSYSRLLRQVKYGHNKDHEPLPQINLGLVFGQTSRLPVCYRKLPGMITDVKLIPHLMKTLEFLDVKKVFMAL